MDLLINIAAAAAISAFYAVGYTIVFGLTNIVAFHLGDMAAVSAICFVWLHSTLMVGALPAILISVALAVILGGLSFFPLRSLRADRRLDALIVTMAYMLIIENVLQLLTHATTIPFPIRPQNAYCCGGLEIQVTQAYLIAAGGLLALAMAAFTRSNFWIKMCAVSENEQGAARCGEDVAKIKWTGFLIGTALVASGGLLSGMHDSVVSFDMGLMPGIRGFTAALLGTWTNIFGAIIAAVVLTAVEQTFAFYVSSAFSDVVTFGVLIGILAFAPGGLSEVVQHLRAAQRVI
jgi:branched-chain amino acid transport system permease protein